MKLTRGQEQLIRRSWGILRDIDPLLVGDVFYTKLFLDHPELRRMFPQEMEGQYEKLVAMLGTIAGRVDKLDELSAEIKSLAVRHRDYGVKPQHYKMIGAALLWMLERALGADWTDEMKLAWTKCYKVLSETMIHI